MSRLNYSFRATHDLIRLFNFLAEKNEHAAKRAIKEIRDSFTLLSHMPKISRPVEEGLSELVVEVGNSGYVALYNYDEMIDEVVAVVIRHQLENGYSQ